MNRGVLFYLMVPLLLFLALLQSTAAGRIQLGQVKPDLVLIMVIVGTLLYGGRSGVLVGVCRAGWHLTYLAMVPLVVPASR